MIIQVSLKDPDGFSDSVDEAVREDVAKLGLAPDEFDAVFETRRDKVWTALKKFVEYQEYLSVEFDTDAETARVVPR